MRLDSFNSKEKIFLREIYAQYKKGVNYLTFETKYNFSSSLRDHAERLGKRLAQTVLYRVCDDLAKRLGIRQGYLRRDEVVPIRDDAVQIRKELTLREVAHRARCKIEDVRQSIRQGRLRARRVGENSLVWEMDAETFAVSRLSR